MDRVDWFGRFFVASLITTGFVALSASSRLREPILDALLWGLWSSGVFILAALALGIAEVRDRGAPLPEWGAVFSRLALFFGLMWVLGTYFLVGL